MKQVIAATNKTSANAFLCGLVFFIGFILTGLVLGIEAPHSSGHESLSGQRTQTSTQQTAQRSRYESYGAQHIELAELNALREMLH